MFRNATRTFLVLSLLAWPILTSARSPQAAATTTPAPAAAPAKPPVQKVVIIKEVQPKAATPAPTTPAATAAAATAAATSPAKAATPAAAPAAAAKPATSTACCGNSSGALRAKAGAKRKFSFIHSVDDFWNWRFRRFERRKFECVRGRELWICCKSRVGCGFRSGRCGYFW